MNLLPRKFRWRLPIYLGLGLLATVAGVAALAVGVTRPLGWQEERSVWLETVSWGSKRLKSRIGDVRIAVDWEPSVIGSRYFDFNAPLPKPIPVPEWAWFARPTQRTRNDGSAVVVETGWPFRAFGGGLSQGSVSSELDLTSSTVVQTHCCYVLGGSTAQWAEMRVLPWRPLPEGLLLDVLLFGGAVGLACELALYVQRARRARANLCVACGYGLGSSGICPECGLGMPSGVQH